MDGACLLSYVGKESAASLCLSDLIKWSFLQGFLASALLQLTLAKGLRKITAARRLSVPQPSGPTVRAKARSSLPRYWKTTVE
jgi:hypothetical protein